MEALAEAAAYALAAVLAGICCTWAYMLRSMARTFRRSPHLADFEPAEGGAPAVSVILPARNEEAFIGRCLDSLEVQDYADYEVIAVDDSSEDATGRIIAEHAARDPRVVHVAARPKPPGWMGKNWACMEGYRRARGGLLMFTDADTVHSPAVISMAAGHLGALGLDALTAVPRILALDFWTRVTLPVVSTFLHTRFSPLNVNDPSKKTGYFFGSFFMMRRAAYEAVGMHEGVRGEIIEDGALGRKTKSSGHAMRMVRAEGHIRAVWARDRRTLWDAIKRMAVPLYLQGRAAAVGIFLVLAFLLFVPFAAAAGSAALAPGGAPGAALAASSLCASALVVAGAAVEARAGLRIPAAYSLLAPLGSLVMVSGFLAGLVRAAGDSRVAWRGRDYDLKGCAQNPVEI